MAVNVAWNGFGRVSNANSLTNWTALKISGTGGGPTAAIADGQIEGTGAVTVRVNRQRVALYFDIGAGNELDFTVGGNEEGQMVFTWANFLAAALLNNQSVGGFGIFLASAVPSTTNYHLFYHYGADNYSGGWKRLAIDPTSTVSDSSGTLDLSSVRYFGVFADVGGATARFDNLICDAIDVGFGLRVTGTATTDDWIGDMITNEETNRYGGIISLNDSQNAYGLGTQLLIGDNVGITISDISDVNKKLFLEEPLYYDGISVINALPIDFYKIEIVGNTTVNFGKKVGSGDSAQGRNGLTIVGNNSYNLSIDFDDGSVGTCNIYGTTFERVTGTLIWGTNSSHECIGNTFLNSSQFNPVGGIVIRACNFVGFVGTTGALLWNDNIDIKNSRFINCDNAIQKTTTVTPIVFDGLIFDDVSGKYDINNTSGVTITINLTNNANTNSFNPAGSTVLFINTKTFTFVLNPSIVNYEWRIYEIPVLGSLVGSVEVAGEESASVDNQVYNYNFTADQPIAVQIISQPDNDFKEETRYFTLVNNNQDITIDLEIDNNN